MNQNLLIKKYKFYIITFIILKCYILKYRHSSVCNWSKMEDLEIVETFLALRCIKNICVFSRHKYQISNIKIVFCQKLYRNR